MPIGKELITNSGFEDGVSGWTAVNARVDGEQGVPFTGSGSGYLGTTAGLESSLTQVVTEVGPGRRYRLNLSLSAVEKGDHPEVNVTLVANPWDPETNPDGTTVLNLTVPANSLKVQPHYRVFEVYSTITPTDTAGATLTIVAAPAPTGNGVRVDDVSLVERS